MNQQQPINIGFQIPPIIANPINYMEESNILLQKAERYATGYDLTRQKIMKICSENNIACPNIIALRLSTMMSLLINRYRWHDIIVQVFRGIIPPIQKHPIYKTYMIQYIPVNQMTIQQKKRIDEIGGHVSAAVWSFLTRAEKWTISGGVHGMKLSIDYMLVTYEAMIHKDDIVLLEDKNQEKNGPEEITDESDHSSSQRRSKRIRLQSQNK